MSDIVELKKFISDNLVVVRSLSSDKDDTPRVRRNLQHFISLRPKNPALQTNYEVLLNYALASEKRCPGAGLQFLQSFVEDTSCKVEIPKDRPGIRTLISSLGYDKIIIELLLDCLDRCSSGTKILISETKHNRPFVELTDGFTFNLNPIVKNQKDLVDCRVVCIDGYIESVSEIHHVLQKFSESAQPFVIFCRGASNDVAHTVKVNNDRGTLSAHLYAVPFDLGTANTIVDLAVISGTDMISSLKGQTISSIDIEGDTGRLESLVCRGTFVTIKNSRTKSNVEQHKSRLKDQVKDRPEIEEILSSRLKNLTPSCLEIFLPDDINVRSRMQQLDEGVRIISAILQNAYDPAKVVKETKESWDSHLKNTFTVVVG